MMKNKTIYHVAVAAMMLFTAGTQHVQAASVPGTNNVQQSAKVFGTVTDGTEPIIGASVKVKGTSQGVVTDLDGRFSLDVEPGTELIISYIGYKDVEVKASANMHIVLEEESTALNEVVVRFSSDFYVKRITSYKRQGLRAKGECEVGSDGILYKNALLDLPNRPEYRWAFYR